ncbi:Flagellar L-ring protein (plasmid) [Rhodovastum atsumiense]|uniref:flagellar basal body L-ring protein FlgH n=1 Tax=Rhodovastum atsumiense TaxID=504468 RepID=UPI002024EA07|nr:flagellar basal body L-ring protein FlgH [Rhodovastum atsumiense]CAH2605449.1 Flagellar L-ring protein [Rhodovastum atsumiense]
MKSNGPRFLLVLVLPLAMAACDSFGHVQQPPSMSAPGNADIIPDAMPISPPLAAAHSFDAGPTQQGSLWRRGAKTFFRDPRARGVGDLLTVSVNMQEQAEFANQTALQRDTANGMTVPNLFGLGTFIGRVIPGLKNTDPTIATTGQEKTEGKGDIKRSENIRLAVAATVLRVLPNNNLEIAGSQQIRLNNELRELQIRGIVRPEDIRSDNTIPSEKIAEARIAYGGRGVSSDLQRPKWGQDLLQRFQPF